MRPPRVLVAYGSTAELAGWMAGGLREVHLSADVVNAADMTRVSGYDAVILGGTLYAGTPAA